MDDKKARDKLG